MIAMGATNLPERAMRQQMSSAIQLVVQQTRLSDGSRKITSISEITGMEGRRDHDAGDLRVRENGCDAGRQGDRRFRATGVRPKCCERLRRPASICRRTCSKA